MTSFTWSDFWKEEKQCFDPVMRISTTFFARQFEKRFNLKSTDEILDYGCGPGFVGEYLIKKKIAVTGADINESYIKSNERRQPSSLFIRITTDIEANKEIFDAHFKTKKFDFIIMVSIIQYFRSHQELEKVVNLLYPYLRQKGRLILADIIDDRTSSIKDAMSLLLQCIKHGKVNSFFKFIFYLLTSNYRKLSTSNKLLKVSELAVRQIAEKYGMDCERINGLTIHSSRTNYILTRVAKVQFKEDIARPTAN